MNINKRMLQFGAAMIVVAIGCNALAVDLDIPLKESFETYDPETTVVTNLPGWSSTIPDDESVIVTNTYALAGDLTWPLAASNHTQVLKLNTYNGELSAKLNENMTDFASDKIYIDAVVQLVASEDDWVFDGMTNIKIAVWANAQSNLMVRHVKYNEESVPTTTNSDTGITIGSAQWYRLTITVKNLQEFSIDYPLFSVAVDGVTITNANARDSGIWFDALGPTDELTKLTEIAFKGSGYVDDLVVTRDVPSFVPTPLGAFFVYTVINGNGAYTVGELGSFTTNTTVEVIPGDDLTIVYTATNWYRINPLLTDGVTNVDASAKSVYTQDLTSVQAHYSNNVTFAAATGDETGLGNTNAWASRFFATEADAQQAAAAGGNFERDYLLNIDPSGTHVIGFEIIAINVVGTNVVVTSRLTNQAEPFVGTINGVLKVYGKESLVSPTWQEIATAEVTDATFVNGEENSASFDAVDYKFFKAVIEAEPAPIAPPI